MKEMEQMKDEPVATWDTFGKKTWMNFLQIGAHKDLLDSGLGPLSGSELHQTRTFARL